MWLENSEIGVTAPIINFVYRLLKSSRCPGNFQPLDQRQKLEKESVSLEKHLLLPSVSAVVDERVNLPTSRTGKQIIISLFFARTTWQFTAPRRLELSPDRCQTPETKWPSNNRRKNDYRGKRGTYVENPKSDLAVETPIVVPTAKNHLRRTQSPRWINRSGTAAEGLTHR